MGRFTDEMTRLVGEIVAVRGARKGFVKDLTQNTAALMANFHRPTKTWPGRPRPNGGPQ